jgi:hypothetical protein
MIQVLKEKLERRFKHGLLTEDQYKQAIVKIDTVQVKDVTIESLKPFNIQERYL